ncbi:hypothetical protein ACHAXN_005635 [Cyclotella atomus]
MDEESNNFKSSSSSSNNNSEPSNRSTMLTSPTLQQSQSLGGILTDFQPQHPESSSGTTTAAAEKNNEASFSMTLAISPADTQRLFSASSEFNRQVTSVRQEILNDDNGERELTWILREAARKCQLDLVQRFLQRKNLLLQDDHDSVGSVATAIKKGGGTNHWNVDIGLLFLLDSDKSIKLLVAFDTLSKSSTKEQKVEEKKDVTMKDVSKPPALRDLNDELADRLLQENATTSKLLDVEGATTLFFSVLSAISICVHDVDNVKNDSLDETAANNNEASRAPTPTTHNKSPEKKKAAATTAEEEDAAISATGDWKSSHKTQKEIHEIATFAAENLMEFASASSNDNANDDGNHDATTVNPPMVSFDIFGKWYNAGGFSLVPWLELLDLSKWDNHHSPTTARSSNCDSSSSSKRPRPNYDYGTPGMSEAIGSPGSLFAAGAAVGAESAVKMMESSSLHSSGIHSFSAMFGERNDSPTVVSFDFSGSATTSDRTATATSNIHQDGFQIDITEENLLMLQNLVHRTNLANLTPQQVEEVMMKHAHVEKRHGETVYVISRTQYNKFIRGIVPKEASNNFDPDEIQNFSNYFSNFFTCFDYSWSDLKKDEVNAKELVVGFSFLCAGNKSVKLAAAYEMLDVERVGYLSQRGLLSYLRSYLTMLAGISLLSSSKKNTHQIKKNLTSERRHEAFLAVENGAKWTLGHFLKVFELEVLQNQRGSTRGNAVTFEDFAKWYTDGGYKIAPWLELLDLKKFLSLIGDASRSNPSGAATNTAEVLFTFPLANSRSLVVLRDDAVYVRQVVAELGLLSLTSEDIWSALHADVTSNLAKTNEKKASSASVEVNQSTFVQSMIRILIRTSRQKQKAHLAKTETTLQNLYSSFDMTQINRVALNQLMCGLTLLCGGKKSNKLMFAFGLFDSDDSNNGKRKASLGHDDFFYFFRSFLIVMFSCCYQSLDLSADEVGKYISDTAKSVADNVMEYWRAKKVNKVTFDQFSEWYNEGGYEIIPWLELLDLNKWVLADHAPPPPSQHHPAPAPHSQYPLQMPGTPGPMTKNVISTPAAHTPGMLDTPASFQPSPNHEFKALLASPRHNGHSALPDGDPLFDLDMSALDAEVDDNDFILQNDAAGTDHAHFADHTTATVSQEDRNALKFHLFSNDHHRGYMISIRPTEVSQLHRIVTETALCQADASTVCNFILSEAKSNRSKNTRTLSKRAFHAAMTKVCQQISQKILTGSTRHELTAFLDKLFSSFDRPKKGSVHALEIACGITVLCGGRKSDKLEHVFELFDEDKDTLLTQKEVARFIQSFLVVLMSISSSISLLDGGACTNDDATLVSAIETGSEWASAQVFEALKPPNGKVCFDDFADWYTKGGYQHIPWLELLDLKKWVLGQEAS